MIFFAMLVQIIASVISITIEDFSKAFLPHFDIVVPIVNISCSTICLFLLIKPKFRFLQSVVLFLQGITMTLNNLIFLGVFLYCLGIVLLFCYGYIKTQNIKKNFLFTIPILLCFFLILPTSKSSFFMAWAFSLFILCSYFHLYNTIKNSIFDLFPFLSGKISSRDMPETGSSIKLSDYGLSERQIDILRKYLQDSSSYKELAETFLISESSIKKEMATICKNMGVKNTDILSILLQQYKIEEFAE